MKTTLVICDIQPEYESYLDFRIKDFIAFLNRTTYERITYFFNGYDTLGMVREEELKQWLSEWGANERKLDRIEFVDKGYGFIAAAFDSNDDDETIIKYLRQMKENNVWDSSELPSPPPYRLWWNKSFEIIAKQEKIIFIGGSTQACLLELEFGAKALNVPYEFNEKYLYT